jgi:hypothetical protein
MASLDGEVKREPWTVHVVTPQGEVPALDFVPHAGWVASHPKKSDIRWSQSHSPAHMRGTPRLRRVSWFLIVLSLLQVLDMASTLLLLSIGGVEANPIAAWSLQQGVPAFVAMKIGLAAVLLAFVPLIERERGPIRATTWACLGFDVLFAAVVASNVAQFVAFA